MRREDQCGITWDTHTVWGTRRSIDAVERAISAQACVMSLRDEVMRLQILLKAAEQRVSDMSWTPGSYQNGA
jgi:hypothetical protein